jgi:hypothetical protein
VEEKVWAVTEAWKAKKAQIDISSLFFYQIFLHAWSILERLFTAIAKLTREGCNQNEIFVSKDA